MIFISNAMAQEAADAMAANPSGGLSSFIPLVFIIVIMYFLLIRPQQKRLKEHQSMIQALKRNDNVVTAGGIHGKIKKIEDQTGLVHVEIAKDVVVKLNRNNISELASANNSSSDEKDSGKVSTTKTSKKKATS